MKRALVVAAVVAIGALGGCGGGGTDDLPDTVGESSVIDADAAEAAIEANLSQGEQSFTVDSVDCPDDVDVEPNTTFDCEVNVSNGQDATATLKIQNENADVQFVKLTPHD